MFAQGEFLALTVQGTDLKPPRGLRGLDATPGPAKLRVYAAFAVAGWDEISRCKLSAVFLCRDPIPEAATDNTRSIPTGAHGMSRHWQSFPGFSVEARDVRPGRTSEVRTFPRLDDSTAQRADNEDVVGACAADIVDFEASVAFPPWQALNDRMPRAGIPAHHHTGGGKGFLGGARIEVPPGFVLTGGELAFVNGHAARGQHMTGLKRHNGVVVAKATFERLIRPFRPALKRRPRQELEPQIAPETRSRYPALGDADHATADERAHSDVAFSATALPNPLPAVTLPTKNFLSA